MTPNPDAGNDSVAGRLERAIADLIQASMSILHHDGREGDKVDVYERAQLRKAFTPILRAALRRASSDTSAREVQVAIWSGEHCAYWRANGAGYTTDIRSIGSYSYADAVAHTKHCGPEKMIEIIPWPSATPPPPPLRRAVGEEEAGET